MTTNRKFRTRGRYELDAYEIVEALTLKPPLIGVTGFFKRGTDIHKRDDEAIAEAWATHEEKLLQYWITGWMPGAEAKFTGMKEPGFHGTRPPGWWKYAAPQPQRHNESQPEYLDRLDLWLEGERAAAAKYMRRAKVISKLA